jgi:hypothetical protein
MSINNGIFWYEFEETTYHRDVGSAGIKFFDFPASVSTRPERLSTTS